METPVQALERAERLAQLTTRYSRFSRSFGGLGTALCGALGLGLTLLTWLGPRSALQPWLVAVLPAGLLARELLRRLYYQSRGLVTELQPSPRRFSRLALFSISAATSWVALPLIVYARGLPSDPGVQLYLLAVFAAPLFAWEASKGLAEALLFMVYVAVVIAVASHAPPEGWTLVASIAFSARALVVGVFQHRAFLRLRRELDALHDDEPPASSPSDPRSPTPPATRGLATLGAALAVLPIVASAALRPATARSAVPAAALAYLAVHALVVRLGRLAPAPRISGEKCGLLIFSTLAFWAAFSLFGAGAGSIPPLAVLGGALIVIGFAVVLLNGSLALLEWPFVGWLASEAWWVHFGRPLRGELALGMLALLAATAIFEHVEQRRAFWETPHA